MLLIPYFVVMGVLAAYGLHRYALVFMYYRGRRNKTVEPASRFAELPRITACASPELKIKAADAAKTKARAET